MELGAAPRRRVRQERLLHRSDLDRRYELQCGAVAPRVPRCPLDHHERGPHGWRAARATPPSPGARRAFMSATAPIEVKLAHSGAAVVNDQMPWPGLLPFTEAMAPYFHGRDDDADELVQSIKRATLTILYGKSGLG